MTDAEIQDDYDYDDHDYDDHDYEDEQYESRDVQKLLLKSFMVVVFCYTLFCTGMAIIGGFIFSEFFQAASTLEPAEFTRQLQENSAELFQRGRYLPFVGLSAVFCFFLGRIVTWLAPFSKMVHAVALVLLVAATMFVFATGEKTPPELQTLAMIMVACGPVALVIGARMAIGKMDPGSDQQ